MNRSWTELKRSVLVLVLGAALELLLVGALVSVLVLMLRLGLVQVLVLELGLGLGLGLVLVLVPRLMLMLVPVQALILVLVGALDPVLVQELAPNLDILLIPGLALVPGLALGLVLGLRQRKSQHMTKTNTAHFPYQKSAVRLVNRVAITLTAFLPPVFSLEDRAGITVVMCETCEEAYKMGGGWRFRQAFTKEICGLLWLIVYSRLVRGKKYASR